MGKCICKNCGVEFEKPNSEINRNNRLGRPNFCSRSCVGNNNAKNLLNVKERYDITQHSDNRKDGYSKFRYHLRNISKRKHEVTVTLDDLKDQWDKQSGVCPYTGIKLNISTYTKIKKDPIRSASLDRIESNKGYIKGNIRWVSRSVNWMKNEMTDDMVDELINLLIENKKGSRRTL